MEKERGVATPAGAPPQRENHMHYGQGSAKGANRGRGSTSSVLKGALGTMVRDFEPKEDRRLIRRRKSKSHRGGTRNRQI